MNNLKYSIGIDVSKNDCNCCVSVINDQLEVKVKATRKFANSAAGFKAFDQWVETHCKEVLPTIFVMEATGVYHEQVAWFLHEKGKQVAILLANKAKKYLEAQGQRSKNDSIDAKGLSRLGAERKLDLWTPPSEKLQILRSYTRQHQNLNEMHSAVNNQLHSVQHSKY